MPEPTEQPNPAELELYPNATMSERAAERVLAPFKQQRVSSETLARASAFHADTELQRQDNAAAKAALRAAHAEVDQAERRATKLAQSYLIHRTKASTSSPDAVNAEYDSTFDTVESRLERMALAKSWSLGFAQWLDEQDWAEGQAEHACDRADGLRTCGSYLVVRELVGLDENRLAKANFCKKPRICPMCAMRRAAKEVQAHAPVVMQKVNETGAMPYALGTTVKDGPDLEERLTHLTSGWRQMLNHRRKVRSRSSRHKGGVISAVEGGRYAVEIKRGSGSNLWHPHIHAVVLAHEEPDEDQLAEEWYRVTGDSYIVNVQPMYCHEAIASTADPREAVELLAHDLVEILKYPCKFSSMTHADTWHAYRVMDGKTLASSFGCLRCVDVDESLLDDPITPEDWPYIEVVARWMWGSYELERGDDWTHNDDSDEYYRNRAIKGKAGRFSSAKALAGSGDTSRGSRSCQASPQGGSS